MAGNARFYVSPRDTDSTMPISPSSIIRLVPPEEKNGRLILLCEMGIILSISRAGNAQNAARSKRSHEELARRMNPQRRTHKALHSN